MTIFCYYCSYDSIINLMLFPSFKIYLCYYVKIIFKYKTFIVIKQQQNLAMKTLILIFCIFFIEQITKAHDCAFHQYAGSSHYKSKIMDAKKFFSEHLHNNSQKTQHHGRLLYGAGRPLMRITLNVDDFGTLKASANGQPQTTFPKLNFVLKTMYVAKNFYENRLRVASSGIINVPSQCYDFNTSDTNGIGSSDLHIYVRYITNSQLGYGATGVSCQWNPVSGTVDPTLTAGRPIVGRIIFNTFNLVDNQASLTNRLFASITSTSIHETLHILGFDQSLYETYLDSDTGLPYNYNITTQQILHSNRVGGANHILKTPNVKAWALSFFGCINITGMPLENQQPGNVRGSHWERLAMYDQLMTGTQLGPQKTFSALTFALLKDMGWYGVDDTFNDTTNYGNQKGCSFYYDACYSNTTSFPKYFCNPASYVNVSQCSSTYTGKATCSSQTALMADGCGLFAEYFHCVDPASVGDFYQSYTLQSFNTNSFCVKGTIANSGITNTYRSRCYPYICNQTTQTITITIGPYTVNCLSNQQGTNKTVTGMQGNIQCPIFQDFCVTARKICPNWCSKNGFCTRGICNCFSNSTLVYSGADCSITTCVAANNFYFTGTSSCVSSCPTGYYANTRSKACLPCDTSCSNCRDQAKICTSCVSTPTNPQYFYQAENICVSQCPNTTFLQVDTCILCSVAAGCATCTGSSTFCTSCSNPTYYLNQLGQCGSSCSVGAYTLYDDINMECQQSCPNYLYLISGHCRRCTPLYKIIDNPNNTCDSNCPPGYYNDSTIYICGNCDSTCQQCDGKYAQNCTSCRTTGIYNFWHLKMCVSTCPNGYYQDISALRCQLCIIQLHCATCSYTSGTVTCDTCQYGYFIQSNQTCTTFCDPHYYPNTWNHSCDVCSNQCADCNGPYPSSCLTCVSPKYYIKNSTGGYCLNACPSIGYVNFMSTTCLPCHQTCRTCINQTSSGCVTCATGLYLQNNICRYVCSPGMYPNQTSMQCLACNNNCQFCFGSTVDNCTECQTGYVLDNYTCTTQCPTGQKANTYNVCDKIQAQSFENYIKLISFMILLMVWLII